jgi:hypothetical protein
MNKKSTLIERYSLPLFLILTPLISLAIPLFLPLPPEIVPLMMVFVPVLLAIFLTALTDGRKGVSTLLKKLFQWQIGFKWYVIVFVLAFGLRLTMSVLALLLGWIPAIQFNPWSPANLSSWRLYHDRSRCRGVGLARLYFAQTAG